MESGKVKRGDFRPIRFLRLDITMYFRIDFRGLLVVLMLWFFVATGTTRAADQYTGNLQHVLGDVKQGQIQNKLDTKQKIDNVLDGFERLGCDGVRITIFPEGTNPNPEMFDYLYKAAKKRGFKIFANPAEHSGGRRLALRRWELAPVKDDLQATRVLIKRVQTFAKQYPCDWINPFNEDGKSGAAFSGPQIQYIYEKLHRRVGGAKLIGPCTWGIPAAVDVLKKTDIEKYITVATTHNLGFNHEKWNEFIGLAKSKRLPVWDSEVNTNKKFPDKPNRLTAALKAGVDGLVLYDSWRSFVNINNGQLTKGGIGVRDLILKDPSQAGPDSSDTASNDYQPNEGDLLFQYAPGNQILNAIADASGDQFSHCGILVKKDDGWFVLEAVGTVKETPIKVWRSRSRDKVMQVYRLKAPLQKHVPKLIAEARQFLGRPHDFNCRMSDTHFYGAELVYKSYKNATGKELGSPMLLKEFEWKPAKEEILKFEKSIPLQRKIITAEILSRSADLQRVYSSKKKSENDKTTDEHR